MTPSRSRVLRWVVGLITIVLLASSCASASVEETGPADEAPQPVPSEESISVLPDYEAAVFTVNVRLTDEGFDPATIHVPAGRQVRLVLRNHGQFEHHYRVVGLVASDIKWYQFPEVDEDEVLAMEAEGGFIGDPEHVLHHLTPEFVPFKEESRLGIRPLPTEVHGYTHQGDHDVILFYPLNTGSFLVEDVAFPEITGKFVVFDASVYES